VSRGIAVLIVAALAVATACATRSPSPSPSPIQSPPPCDSPAVGPGGLNILVLGDSIAAGDPLKGDDRWSATLQRLLAAALPQRVVYVCNAAVGGSRIDFLESSIAGRSDLGGYQVGLVIEGVNDDGFTPLEEWARRYAAAVAVLEAKGLAVVIGTSPPTIVDGRFTDRYQPIADALRRIAADEGRLLLDIERHWRGLGAEAAGPLYSDLIHQGPAGQAVMAEMAASLIRTLPAAR
jgi:lysophospholipase L1-like esterase